MHSRLFADIRPLLVLEVCPQPSISHSVSGCGSFDNVTETIQVTCSISTVLKQRVALSLPDDERLLCQLIGGKRRQPALVDR